MCGAITIVDQNENFKIYNMPNRRLTNVELSYLLVVWNMLSTLSHGIIRNSPPPSFSNPKNSNKSFNLPTPSFYYGLSNDNTKVKFKTFPKIQIKFIKEIENK
jgi:hypothetical protein